MTAQVPSARRVVVSVSTVSPSVLEPSWTSTVTSGASLAALLAVPENAGVTSLVALPSAGLASVNTAVVSIVHVRVAGTGSTLPARSIERTSKVCSPAARWL